MRAFMTFILGLAVLAIIGGIGVEAHGGRIRADAGPGGVGTVVAFGLPVAPTEEPLR